MKSRFRITLLVTLTALALIYYIVSQKSELSTKNPAGNLRFDYESYKSLEQQQHLLEQQLAQQQATETLSSHVLPSLPPTQLDDPSNPKKFLGEVNAVPPLEIPPVSSGKKELLGVPPQNLFLKTVTKSEPPVPKGLTQTLANNYIKPLKFRLYSHNVKNGGTHDLIPGELSWDERVKDITSSMKFHSTESTIFTLQELYKYQLLDILAQLNKFDKQWTFYGVGRVNGEELGELVPIIYNTNQWELLYNDTFWLNDKDPRSSLQGWDAIYTRIASVVTLRHKQLNNIISVFNTHFDHIGKTAKSGSSELILKRINQLVEWSENQWPSFVAGDFNAEPNEACIKQIKEFMVDSVSLASVGNRFGHFKSTVTGFEGEVLRDGGQNIDYIFAPKYTKRIDQIGGTSGTTSICDKSIKSNIFEEKADLALIQFGMLHSKFNGRYMSDHRPIVADFIINHKCQE